MKQTLISLCILLNLTGCATKSAPVTVKFPPAPADLTRTCPDLKTVDPKTDKLSAVLDTVTDNYITYYECKATVGDWIEWYTTQKSIFDRIYK
jgi:hypothetical protein